MAKTRPSHPHCTSTRAAKTSKGVVRPPTRGARGASTQAAKKKKLSSQSDDEEEIDLSLCKPPPIILATMPSLVALPSLPPPKKCGLGGGGKNQGLWGRMMMNHHGMMIKVKMGISIPMKEWVSVLL